MGVGPGWGMLPLPTQPCVRGAGRERAGLRRARPVEGRGGAFGLVAGAEKAWARLVYSHGDLQRACGRGPKGRPAAAPASAPSPTAAEVHEVCSHQDRKQQAIEAQR